MKTLTGAALILLLNLAGVTLSQQTADSVVTHTQASGSNTQTHTEDIQEQHRQQQTSLTQPQTHRQDTQYIQDQHRLQQTSNHKHSLRQGVIESLKNREAQRSGDIDPSKPLSLRERRIKEYFRRAAQRKHPLSLGRKFPKPSTAPEPQAKSRDSQRRPSRIEPGLKGTQQIQSHAIETTLTLQKEDSLTNIPLEEWTKSDAGLVEVQFQQAEDSHKDESQAKIALQASSYHGPLRASEQSRQSTVDQDTFIRQVPEVGPEIESNLTPSSTVEISSREEVEGVDLRRQHGHLKSEDSQILTSTSGFVDAGDLERQQFQLERFTEADAVRPQIQSQSFHHQRVPGQLTGRRRLRFPNRRRVFKVRRPGPRDASSRKTARPQMPSVGAPAIDTQQMFTQVEDSTTTNPRTQVQDDQSSSFISAAHQTSKVDLLVKSDNIQRTQVQTPAIFPITSKDDRVSLHSSSLDKVTEVKVSHEEQNQVTGATEDPNLVENAFHQIGQVLQEPEITDAHQQSHQTPSRKVDLRQEVKKSESQPIKIESVNNRPTTTEKFVHTRTSHQQIPQVNPLHQQAIQQEQIISTQLQQVDGQNLSKKPGDQQFTQPPQSNVAVTSNAALLQKNHAVKPLQQVRPVQQNPKPQTTAQVSQLSSRQGRLLSLHHQEPKLSRHELANRHFSPAQLSLGPHSTKPQVTLSLVPLNSTFKPHQQTSQTTFTQRPAQASPQKQRLSNPQGFSQGPALQHQVSQAQHTERGEFPATSLSQHSQFLNSSQQGRGQQALIHKSASAIDHFSPQLLHFQHATTSVLHPNIQVNFNGGSHEAQFNTPRTNVDRSEDFQAIGTKTKLASTFQSGGQDKVTRFQADRRAIFVIDQPVQHTKSRLPQMTQPQKVSGTKFSGQFSNDRTHLRHELDRSTSSHHQQEQLSSQQRRVNIQEEQHSRQELSRRQQQVRAKSKVEQLTRSQENKQSILESHQRIGVAESGLRESHGDRFREDKFNIRNTRGPSIVNKLSRPGEGVASSHDEGLTFTSDQSRRDFHQSESTFRQEKHRATEDENLRVSEETSFNGSPHDNFKPSQNINVRAFQNEQLRGAQEDALTAVHIDQFKTSQAGIARVTQNNNFRAPLKHFSTADVAREHNIRPLQANTYRPTQIEHFAPQKHNIRSQEEHFRAVQGDQNIRLKQREDFRTPQGTLGLRNDQVNFRDQYFTDQQADIRGSHIADFRETQSSNYRDRSGVRDQNSEFAGGEISARNDASRFRGNQHANLRDRDQFSQFGDGRREDTSRFRGNQQSNFRGGESNFRITENSALNFREKVSDTRVRPSDFGIRQHDANARDQRPNLGNRAQNLRQRVTNLRGNEPTNLRTNQHRFSDGTSSFSAAEARFRAKELAHLEHINQNTAGRVSSLRDDSRLQGQYSDFTRNEGARRGISSDRSGIRSHGSRRRPQQAPSQALRRQEQRSRAREGQRQQNAQVRIEDPVRTPRTSEFNPSLSRLDQSQGTGVWGSQLQHPYQDRTSPPTQSSLTPSYPTPNSHFVSPSFPTRQPSDTFSDIKASTFEDRREITGGVSSHSSSLHKEIEASVTSDKGSRSRVRGESVAITDIGSSHLAATSKADNTFQVSKVEKANDFARQQEERAFTISQSEGLTRSSQDNLRTTQGQASSGHDTRPSPPSPQLVHIDRDVALENYQPRQRPIINSHGQPGFNYQGREELTQSHARVQKQDLKQASLKQRTVQTSSAKLSSSVSKIDRAPPTPSLINRHHDQTALKTKAQTHTFSQDSKVTRTLDIQHHDHESTEKLTRTHASAPGRGTRKFVDSLPAGVGEGVEDGGLLKSLMVLLRGEDLSSGRSGHKRSEHLSYLQPTLPNIPETGFRCRGLPTGYYADAHADAACISFHFCSTNGSKSSYLCPAGTAFNQRLQVCDHAFRVDCGRTRDFYPTSSSSVVARGHEKREAGDEEVKEEEKQ